MLTSRKRVGKEGKHWKEESWRYKGTEKYDCPSGSKGSGSLQFWRWGRMLWSSHEMKDQFGEGEENTGKINEGEVACWLYLVVRHAANKRLSKTWYSWQKRIFRSQQPRFHQLTLLRCCKTSTDDAALCAQQKRGKLALTWTPQTRI